MVVVFFCLHVSGNVKWSINGCSGGHAPQRTHPWRTRPSEDTPLGGQLAAAVYSATCSPRGVLPLSPLNVSLHTQAKNTYKTSRLHSPPPPQDACQTLLLTELHATNQGSFPDGTGFLPGLILAFHFHT